MRKVNWAVLIVAIVITAGCASVSRGSKQQIHLNAYDAKTNNVVPADCFLSNDEGILYSKSNKSTNVGRDKDPLTIYCHTDALAGKSIVEGRVNGGFVAADFFLLDFCLISGWIDGLSGSWSEYPTNIDISLNQKDDLYLRMLEEKSLELKQQIENEQSQFEGTIPKAEDPNYSFIVEGKQNLERSRFALKMLDSELSSKR